MAIIKTDEIEIEIQKQTMDKPGSNYLILIKSEDTNNNLLKLFTSNKKPIIKFTEDNGNIVKNNFFCKQ
tara:strand:+ start:181 stop:387 length:207 start_codon:yes stop_codon:yes gene_type:complete